jgi:hypothetical protein
LLRLVAGLGQVNQYTASSKKDRNDRKPQKTHSRLPNGVFGSCLNFD